MKAQTWINIANGLGVWDQPMIDMAPKRPTGRRGRSAKESLDRMQAAALKREKRAQKRRQQTTTS